MVGPTIPGEEGAFDLVGPEPPQAKRRKVRRNISHLGQEDTTRIELKQGQRAVSLSPAGHAASAVLTIATPRRQTVGSGCRQVLQHEAAYIATLPSAEMYERSYMHRDTVTHVAVAQVPQLRPVILCDTRFPHDAAVLLQPCKVLRLHYSAGYAVSGQLSAQCARCWSRFVVEDAAQRC